MKTFHNMSIDEKKRIRAALPEGNVEYYARVSRQWYKKPSHTRLNQNGVYRVKGDL